MQVSNFLFVAMMKSKWGCCVAENPNDSKLLCYMTW